MWGISPLEKESLSCDNYAELRIVFLIGARCVFLSPDAAGSILLRPNISADTDLQSCYNGSYRLQFQIRLFQNSPHSPFEKGGSSTRHATHPAFIARLPPSMGNSAPVIQAEASEARKMATPLMSSGVPRRPAGIPLKKVALRLGSASIRASNPLFTT